MLAASLSDADVALVLSDAATDALMLSAASFSDAIDALSLPWLALSLAFALSASLAIMLSEAFPDAMDTLSLADLLAFILSDALSLALSDAEFASDPTLLRLSLANLLSLALSDALSLALSDTEFASEHP